jgi:hypothetical protein
MSGKKLTAKFDGSIRALKEKDFDQFGISKAAVMEKAKSLIPDGFDPNKNIDVLPVVFNLAVVNKFNANGDGIDSSTAIEMVKRFINKPINIEHKKNKIVGHIINASLSDKEPEYKENDLKSFSKRKDPYFITAAGLIYKHVYPDLAKAIEQASDEKNSEYQSISTSWELGFKNYKVVYGSDRLDESEIIEDEAKAAEMKKMIKGFGGKGQDEYGKKINRLIVGEVYPLGAALTRNPAASVSGVYMMEDEEEEEEMQEEEMEDEEDEMEEDEMEEEEMEEEEMDDEMKKTKAKQKNSLIARNIVKIKNLKETLNMNEKQFEQFLQKLEESVASVNMEESHAKSVSLVLTEALKEYGDTWKSKIQEEVEAKEKMAAELVQLQTSLETTQKELQEMKAEAESKAAVELFNSRMNAIEADYSLTDDELSFVAAEIKNLDSSEEAFASYQNKFSILFANKAKAFLDKQEAEIQAKIEEEVAKRLQSSTASTSAVEEKTEENEELEIEATACTDIINNNGEGCLSESLVEKLKKNFSVEIKL